MTLRDPAQGQPPIGNGFDATHPAYRASHYEGLQATNETGLHAVSDHADTVRHEGSTEKLDASATVIQTSPYSVVSPYTVTTAAARPTVVGTAGPELDPYQAMHAGSRDYTYGSQPQSIPPSSAAGSGGEQKILGLRRTTFFLTLSNVVLAIGLVLVGVLVSKAGYSSAGSCTTGSAAAASSGTTTSSAPVSTGTVAANAVCFATAQTAANSLLGTPTVDCPRAQNLTRYVVPNAGLTFERACGIDYTGNDLGRFPVVSMLDCIHLCAQLHLFPSSALGRCAGVSWVFGDGQQGLGVSYCYPKTNVTAGVSSRSDTESAALVLS